MRHVGHRRLRHEGQYRIRKLRNHRAKSATNRKARPRSRPRFLVFSTAGGAPCRLDSSPSSIRSACTHGRAPASSTSLRASARTFRCGQGQAGERPQHRRGDAADGLGRRHGAPGGRRPGRGRGDARDRGALPRRLRRALVARRCAEARSMMVSFALHGVGVSAASRSAARSSFRTRRSKSRTTRSRAAKVDCRDRALQPTRSRKCRGARGAARRDDRRRRARRIRRVPRRALDDPHRPDAVGGAEEDHLSSSAATRSGR